MTAAECLGEICICDTHFCILVGRHTNILSIPLLGHDRVSPRTVVYHWNKSFNTIRNETKISVMVMACCLKAPSHYLNQCRLGNSDVLWHSHKGNFTERITIWVSKLLIHNYSHIFQGPMSYINDDVIKRKHFPSYWPFVRVIHWSPMNSPHTGQWRGASTFSLICAWTNSWANNGDAGD